MLSFPLPVNGHPCFEKGSCGTSARVHLPVAPECNTACNFCNRKFDCPNEGRPGVSSSLLRPENAVEYLKQVYKEVPLEVIGIAGPGDPLANPEKVFKTLELVREAYPDAAFCMATNGLALPDYVEEIKRLGVGFMTVTINAATPETGAKVYRWARYKKKILRGEEGAARMLENQLMGIRMLKAAGITVKVNTVMIPGINDHEIESIAELARLVGADVMNILPMMPVEDTPFANLTPSSAEEVKSVRTAAGEYVRQISHCRRCRADAVGTLTNGLSPEKVAEMLKKAAEPAHKTRVALTSREGVLVNQHLGEAQRFLIYELNSGEAALLEEREAPGPGTGDIRWQTMCVQLKDCGWIAVSGIGGKPQEILESAGIRTVVVSGTVSEVAGSLLTGEDVSHLAVNNFKCSGGSGRSCA